MTLEQARVIASAWGVSSLFEERCLRRQELLDHIDTKCKPVASRTEKKDLNAFKRFVEGASE